MTLSLVCDPSEAMELCASQQLYLKPVVKLAISVPLPEDTSPTKVVSEYEVIEKLKNIICPYQFISINFLKRDNCCVLFEGEAESMHVKEKLHGKIIKLRGFVQCLRLDVIESCLLTSQELEPTLNTRELPEDDIAEQSKPSPDCIHLKDLPCKWFAVKGSGSESPSEDVLRKVFEHFGKIKNVAISLNEHSRNDIQTFEAFVQYQEPASFSKVMETFKGMKLMFKGDAAVVCNIKVTPDNYFCKTAENQRDPKKATLRGLKKNLKSRKEIGGEKTERKQHDDEQKKIGKGRKQCKIKTNEKRQGNQGLKHARNLQKVTDAKDLWKEKMLKQKEKKYSIAQKRLESMRLVSALLNKVKDVAVASKQIGNPLPELENERKVWSFKSQTLDAPKEKVNFLGQQETESKKESGYQLSDLAEASVEEKAQYIPCSRHVLQRNISNRSVAGNYTVSLKVKDTDSHNLKISETQNSGFLKSCYQGDCLGPNTRHFFKPSSVCNSKKLKVYETDEFIHYLLNYYQAPTYSRVIPGLHDPVDTSWQRVVHTAKHQKKEDEQSMMDLSCLANTQEKSPKGSDNWEVTVEEPGVMPESQPRAREFAKNSQVCYKNLSDEAIEGILHGEMNSLPLVSATYDRKSQADDTEMIAMASDKPVGHVNKLKDVLEEISSDSELSGVLDESIRERPIENGGGYERVRLVKDLRISVQSVNRYDLICDYMKCNYCQRNFEDFYSEKIRTFLDGTRGILSQEAQRVNLSKSDQEREAGENKKRKRFSDDEPQLFKANHCEELDPLGETQRKYSKMFHHTMLGEVKAEDVPGCLFQEAHQKADNGNVDIHKTSENGCKTDERQRGCKSGAGRGELRQVGEVEEVVGR